MIIKHILCTKMKAEVFLWFTIVPESSSLTPRTVSDLQKIIEGIKKHAMLSWSCSLEVVGQITVTKIDFTVDL